MEWPSSERIESITERVIGCAITVHTALGPGLLESIYQDCPAIELRTQKVSFEHDHRVRVTYRGEGVRDDLKVDLLVERTVIVEVKAVERLHPVHQAQVIHVPEAHRMSGGSADELQLAEPTRWVEATQSSRLVRRSPRRKERIGCTGTREQEVVSASRSGCEI